MLTTFAVESVLLLCVLWRYKLNAVTRLVALLLCFLAAFQLAEFMVCEGDPSRALMWSRIGFVAITSLPPLGIHLAYALVKAKRRPLLWLAYGTAAAFAFFFGFMGSSLNGYVCSGNYIIFHVAADADLLYAAYYYGLLAVGVWLTLRLHGEQKDRRVRRALLGLMLGYLAFIVPTATVNLLNPTTTEAIPSIMCGFSAILALILVTVIVPASGRRK